MTKNGAMRIQLKRERALIGNRRGGEWQYEEEPYFKCNNVRNVGPDTQKKTTNGQMTIGALNSFGIKYPPMAFHMQ